MSEAQLEIEVAAEMVIAPDEAMLIQEAPGGNLIQLSPARSSAFSTPSRGSSTPDSRNEGLSQHDVPQDDEVDADVPSAVFSSFSLSPGEKESNPSTPERRPRISTTITISPKRNSPGFLAEMASIGSPMSSFSPVKATEAVEEKVTSSAVPFPSLPQDCEPSAVKLQPHNSPNRPSFEPTDPLAQNDEAKDESPLMGSPARTDNSDDGPLQLPLRSDQGGEPNLSRESTPGIDDPPLVVRSPEADTAMSYYKELSAPEKDTAEKSTVVDPNYVLQQIAAGYSSVATPERPGYAAPTELSLASLPTPPATTMDNDATPRVSNNERKNSDVTGSVVESVSSGMHYAFDTLRNLLSEDADAAVAPTAAVDTSLEESAIDLDMQELVNEIREVNAKEEEEKKEEDRKADELKSKEQLNAAVLEQLNAAVLEGGPPQFQEGGSMADATALHRPIPMGSARTTDEISPGANEAQPEGSRSMPPRSPANLPTARPGTRKERLDRMHAVQAARPPSAQPLPPSTPEDLKQPYTSHTATPLAGGTPSTAASTPSETADVPITPTRLDVRGEGAMTPIMRMRHSPPEEEAPIEASSPNHRKSDEEVRANKQRKWKDKMKQVEKNRAEERAELDGSSRRKEERREMDGRQPIKKKGRKRRSSSRSSRKKRPEEASQDSASFMQCQDNGLSRLFDSVMQGRCGELANVSIFEESDTDDGSYYSESESASDDYYDAVEKAATSDEESVARRLRLASSDGSGSHRNAVARGRRADQRHSRSANPDQRSSSKWSSREEARHSPTVRFQEEDGFQPDEDFRPEEGLPRQTIGRISLHEEQTEDPNSVGIQDRNFIHAFIAGATQRGIILYLHKKSRKQTFIRPAKMKTFLKHGFKKADGSFVGPKLTWHAYDDVMAGRIDLFDIRSVDKASPLQLEHYPLAMPGRSLVVKMNRSPDVVFEAMDEEAALRFVHGLRWVVARLTFNLIIGNTSVSCELLDLVSEEEGGKRRSRKQPQSPIEEEQWTTAMNGLTNHLIDKSTALAMLE